MRLPCIPTFLVLFLLFLASFALPCPVASEPVGRPSSQHANRIVLVLESFQEGNPIPDSIDKGLIAGFQESDREQDLFIVHLHLVRVSDAEYRAKLAEMLRAEFQGKNIGMIIVQGTLAARFLVKNLMGLCPAVVMALIVPHLAPLRDLHRKLIVVPWGVDPAGTLRDALALFPKTRRIFVVTGANDSVLPFLEEAKRAFLPWQHKVEFEYSNHMTYAQMLKRSSSLPPNSVILYSPFFRDASGRSFVPAEVVKQICRTADSPVFATLEPYLGSGIVGGSLLRTENIGRLAAKTALAYLEGSLQLHAPLTVLHTNVQTMFDYFELKRWGGDFSRLPADSVEVNIPKTLWGQYKAEVIAAALIFSVLTGFVVLLFAMNARLKHSNDSACESEARFRAIFDSIPDAVLLVDADRRIIFPNPAFTRSFGYEAAEVIGRTPEFLYADRADYVEQGLLHFGKEKVKDGVPYEACYRRKDGSLFWSESIAVHVFAGDGAQFGLMGIHRDITERKRMERSIEEQKRLAEVLIQDSAVAMFVVGPNHKVLFWNTACSSLTGMSSADMVGTDNQWMPFYESRRPCLADLLIDGKQDEDPKLSETGSVSTLPPGCLHAEGWHRNLGGRDRYVVFNAVPVRNNQGEIAAAIETLQDITQSKLATSALQESEKVYRDLFNNTQVAMFRSRLDGSEILNANEKFLELFGGSREEIIGSPSAAHWADRKERDEMTRRLKADGRVVDFECKMLNKQGELLDCITSLSLYPGEGILNGSIVDVTGLNKAKRERDALQEQLNQAQRLESVGRLAGGVAHDFNNMLGVILGHAELAMEILDPADSLFADLTEIKKAAERSADLTKQLLAFARRQTISPRVLDLNETVEGTLKMLRRLIGEDIDLAWLPDQNAWPVEVDPSQIDQLLTNLCVNARDAISGIGKITIETGTTIFEEDYCARHPEFIPGEFAMLAVSDSGCGIDEESLGKIFEPFYTTKGMGEGTGLGLSTVYGIVRQNNGFINVYSEPGQGTTFKIYLPRAEKPNSQEPPVPLRTDLFGKETVLLVEDEGPLLALGEVILQRHGYEVLATKSPTEALQMVRNYSGPLHLLITDVVMPEMNGKDLKDKIAELKPDIKCIFMSGYTANVIAHRGILDKGISFLQKPFSVQALLEKVRDVLDG